MSRNSKLIILDVYDGVRHCTCSFKSENDIKEFKEKHPSYVLKDHLGVLLFTRK